MRVGLVQSNSTVGDLAGNRDRILGAYRKAVAEGADLVVFPELALTGYPPRDLLELPDFLLALERATAETVAATGDAGLLFGVPLPNGQRRGKLLLNGAVLAEGGREVARVGKKLLPTYDVFDEIRQFEPDPDPARPVPYRGISLGIHICEDAWNEEGFWPRRLYDRDPVEELAAAGADVLINLSASPFHAEKGAFRREMFGSHSAHHGVPLLYTNAVGGNDELVFDGQAFVIDARGSILASGVPFEEEILLVEVTAGRPASVTPLASLPLSGGGGARKATVHEPLERVEAVRRALVLGLRDYAAKCGFDSVVLGLSGGIDSSLVAGLAAEALGPERVHGLAIPSRYSSPESVEDARDLARNLGLRFDVVSLEPSFEAMLKTMQPLFGDRPPDIAEENLQARLRGMILMGMANKFGHLLLSTGNKSELAVGYCTLYGDMAGGLAVISDVPKGLVYALSRHLNRGGERIPERVLTKPPSAELRPDQKDEDSLPPYEVLDAILEGHIEDRRGERELVESGLPADTVRRVVEMVARAEYKRRQAAPGIRISPKAFGPGRRMPIATGWPPPGTGSSHAG